MVTIEKSQKLLLRDMLLLQGKYSIFGKIIRKHSSKSIASDLMTKHIITYQIPVVSKHNKRYFYEGLEYFSINKGKFKIMQNSFERFLRINSMFLKNPRNKQIVKKWNNLFSLFFETTGKYYKFLKWFKYFSQDEYLWINSTILNDDRTIRIILPFIKLLKYYYFPSAQFHKTNIPFNEEVQHPAEEIRKLKRKGYTSRKIAEAINLPTYLDGEPKPETIQVIHRAIHRNK